MKFRSGKTIKREFLESRDPQPNESFVAGCNVDGSDAAAALGIRQAIANLGGVDPLYVWAEDLFERELVHFDFWGSLDSIAVVLELEKCLNVRIPDTDAARIADPERTPGQTVAGFVANVLDVVKNRAAEENQNSGREFEKP